MNESRGRNGQPSPQLEMWELSTPPISFKSLRPRNNTGSFKLYNTFHVYDLEEEKNQTAPAIEALLILGKTQAPDRRPRS